MANAPSRFHCRYIRPPISDTASCHSLELASNPTKFFTSRALTKAAPSEISEAPRPMGAHSGSKRVPLEPKVSSARSITSRTGHQKEGPTGELLLLPQYKELTQILPGLARRNTRGGPQDPPAPPSRGADVEHPRQPARSQRGKDRCRAPPKRPRRARVQGPMSEVAVRTNRRIDLRLIVHCPHLRPRRRNPAAPAARPVMPTGREPRQEVNPPEFRPDRAAGKKSTRLQANRVGRPSSPGRQTVIKLTRCGSSPPGRQPHTEPKRLRACTEGGGL
ncbi:hypothetical protein NDU88_002035 [Pleurodeles waltl]|uniref:Uncharacterized protein n=1 Tax=Pleurodeles waltl TaxID=8319 RepID=A0AAV7M9V3_PLEWA|nr:hypothetical protein NDU88_002035 [Pleurodeles waltl]